MLPFNPARYGNVAVRGGSSAFSPASLSPALWLEANAANLFQSNAGSTAVSADGDVVGFWTDLSGNSYNLSSAANDTTRPTYQSNSGHPYVVFDGVNDLLRKVAALGLYANGTCSLFVAVRGNPGTTSLVLAGEENSGSANTRADWLNSDSGTATSSAFFMRGDSGTPSQTGTLNASAWDNTDKVIGLVWDGANVIGYSNSTASASRALASGLTITLNQFALGGLLRTTASNWFAARVYGLVAVKSALNSTDRANLVTYLGNLMGLSL